MMKNKNPLWLTNTHRGKKELFTPIADGKTSLYVCGVTPYDHAHVGHGRSFVCFDVLYRVLLAWGYAPFYVRNITDIDDKIVRRACDTGEHPLAYAERFITSFQKDMHALSCVVPAREPRVSEYLPQIIAYIERLVASGHAYCVGGDVYFSVDSYAEYGALSGRVLDEQEEGARIAVNDAKRNAADFALWKGGVEGALWDSPWGLGRPGWHIECSTFAYELLGITIDIHGGGIDLLFPHHENERAQASALTGQVYARYWVHNAHVMVNKEKMSKSLGNALSLAGLMERYHPMVVRLYILQHHYRSPMDIDEQVLAGVVRAYSRLVRVLNPEGAIADAVVLEPAQLAADVARFPLIATLCQALADDVHTPRAFALLFGALDELSADHELAAAALRACRGLLGLTCEPLPVAKVSSEIEALIAEREAARVARDWKKADELREQLRERGYVITDKKTI